MFNRRHTSITPVEDYRPASKLKLTNDDSEYHPIIERDRAIITLLNVLGVTSVFKPFSSKLQIFSRIWQVLVCLSLAAAAVTNVCLIFSSLGVTFEDKSIFYFTVVCLYQVVTSCVAVLFVYGSYSENGLASFYMLLSKLAFSLEKLNFKTNVKACRRQKAIVWTLIGFLIIQSAYMTVELAYFKADLLTGSALDNRTDNEVIKCLIRVATAISLYNGACVWAAGPMYFGNACMMVSALLLAFNNGLETLRKNKERNLWSSLEEYRQFHLELSNFIGQVDVLFGKICGANHLLSTAAQLVLLYTMAKHQLEISVLITFSFWFILLIFFQFMMIYVSDFIFVQVADVKNTLLKMKISEDVSSYESLMMAQFMDQVKDPPGLTFLGLFVINREFGLTILGIQATYFVVLLQMP